MKMQNTEMEFVTFDAQDIIATSGELTFTVAGLGNGVKGDATITISDGSVIYNARDYSGSYAKEALDALNSKLGGSLTYATKFYNDRYSYNISNLFSASYTNGDYSDSSYNDFNGIYKWISESGYFLKR